MAKKRTLIFLPDQNAEIPSGQDGPILDSQVANQNTGFALSYPPADSAL